MNIFKFAVTCEECGSSAFHGVLSSSNTIDLEFLLDEDFVCESCGEVTVITDINTEKEI